MAAFPTEDRLRQKRTKSEQAISLAMKNRWDEAAQVNRDILDLFPNEVDAFNRLGKALTELGRYAEARDAYSQAVKLDPLNGIASKNLQRLGKLAAEGAAAPSPSPVDPRLFIEESGKTTLTQLTDVRYFGCGGCGDTVGSCQSCHESCLPDFVQLSSVASLRPRACKARSTVRFSS